MKLCVQLTSLQGTACKSSSVLFAPPSTEAVGNIISFLGMQPCERSDKVPENKNSHVLFLAGECLCEKVILTKALAAFLEQLHFNAFTRCKTKELSLTLFSLALRCVPGQS